MNQMVCGLIRSYLTQDLKYHMMTETFAWKLREILMSKYLTKIIENQLHFKRRPYRFKLKKRISIGEHMNNYTNLLADLSNVNEVIKDEDKVLILLSFFSNNDYDNRAHLNQQ